MLHGSWFHPSPWIICCGYSCKRLGMIELAAPIGEALFASLCRLGDYASWCLCPALQGWTTYDYVLQKQDDSMSWAQYAMTCCMELLVIRKIRDRRKKARPKRPLLLNILSLCVSQRTSLYGSNQAAASQIRQL
eukprot:3631121-Amphidinium_carterae.1